jgi:glutathione S-transferase
MAARLMLEHKGIAYRRKDLMPVVSKAALRALGFPGTTVPALKLDGSRIQGSRQIARELDRLRPEPPLLPADPERRAAVEEAERFGDEELQAPIRRLLWWGFKHDKKPMASYAAGAKMGVPVNLAVATGGPLIAMASRFNEADDQHVRADLKALPAMLRRIDDWIAAGVLGGEQPNAGDFQIAPSIGLAMTLEDLRPAIENRPTATLAQRFVPDYPGKMPPILPAEWLEPLREQRAAT